MTVRNARSRRARIRRWNDWGGIPESQETRFDANVRQGEAVLTGGWRTSAGRRGLVMIQAEASQNNSGREIVTITPRSLDVPEELIADMGLDVLKSDSNDVDQHGQILG